MAKYDTQELEWDNKMGLMVLGFGKVSPKYLASLVGWWASRWEKETGCGAFLEGSLGG